jgi:hypothetical protein
MAFLLSGVVVVVIRVSIMDACNAESLWSMIVKAVVAEMQAGMKMEKKLMAYENNRTRCVLSIIHTPE